VIKAPPLDVEANATGQFLLPLFVVEQLQELEPEWSDHDIAALRESILKDALGTVIGIYQRRSATIRQEAWDWIMSHDWHPFSFSACAGATGADPHELKVAFARMVERSEQSSAQDISSAHRLLEEYLEEPGRVGGRRAAIQPA